MAGFIEIYEGQKAIRTDKIVAISIIGSEDHYTIVLHISNDMEFTTGTYYKSINEAKASMEKIIDAILTFKS